MSRVAAGNRHNTRELGRFTSQSTLRANQRALLAPVARWRKEPVKLGNSNIRVTKWVKWLEEGADDEADQVTEEQLAASVDGANSFLQPAVASVAASAPQSTVNTPAVNTPAVNMSGAGTPLVAIQPGIITEMTQATAESEGNDASTLPEPTVEVPSSQVDTTILPESTAGEKAEIEQPILAAEEVASTTGDLAVPGNEAQGATTEAAVLDTTPGQADEGSNMQVEAEQREYDTNMAPELQGQEGEQTRTILGIGDPIGGGPAEIVQ